MTSFFNRRGSASDDDPAPKRADDDNTQDAEIEEVAPALEPPRNTSTRLFDTALGAGSTLEGKLTSDGNVRLDGTFKGNLEVGDNILIGITAEVEADVSAKNVSVAGEVRGNVKGRKVHLLSTARVWGDITAESLITEDGAFIQGRISMSGSTEEYSLPAPKPALPEESSTNEEDEDDD